MGTTSMFSGMLAPTSLSQWNYWTGYKYLWGIWKQTQGVGGRIFI